MLTGGQYAGCVAVVGLGTMGLPIAGRLAKKGNQVYGHDVRRERLQLLSKAGGRPVGSPSGFPKDCKIFLLILPDAEITHEAVFGDDGLVGSLKQGDVVVNLGTIGPDAVVSLGDHLEAHGVCLLDAPMGKSSREAAEGTLSLMVAGNEETYVQVEPLLRCVASEITFCGDLGVASTIKMVNNLVSGTILEAVAEGLVLGVRAGAPLELLIKALSSAGADCYHLRNTFARRVVARDFEPGFSIDLEAKDMKIGLEAAARRRVPLPVIGQAFQRYVEGQASGLGGEDWGALVKLLEQSTNVELRVDGVTEEGG
ncbi:NAD(P)-dependent oxidoreductase [Rubrobacter calidifluminis]|uniref:NAD(P)-dependent oxidoreductase n=1 Tax=Rubrobacter calidifluminis TaxID=1392640 RepID=UPI00235F4195|nr:NAD(P)-dependent oxidoreductase [Rubrobacter calidifluminis]